MKRVCLTLLALACVVSVAMAVEVTSENVAGAIQVHVPAGGIDIAGINLDAIDAADANLKGVFGGQLKAAWDISGGGDRIQVWDTGSSSYKTYQIRPDTGEFYSADTLTEFLIGSPVNPAIVPGDAFWIIANNTDDVDVSLLGQAVSDSEASVQVVSGLQFLSYPLSSEINIQDLDFENDGATASADRNSADWIQFWNGTDYVTYGLKDDNDWWPAGTTTEWIIGPKADVDVNLGSGFWYISRAGSPWPWTEPNQYEDNL